ncbi:MAG: hypothetical protein AAGH60_15610, partial [Pseudomonadota bacterium]
LTATIMAPQTVQANEAHFGIFFSNIFFGESPFDDDLITPETFNQGTTGTAAPASGIADFYASAEIGAFFSNIDRNLLVTEDAVPSLVTAINQDTDVNGWTYGIEAGFGLDDLGFGDGFPNSLSIRFNYTQADGDERYDAVAFPDGLGIPGVGLDPGFYVGGNAQPPIFRSADLFTSRYNIEYESYQLELEKNWLQQSLSDNFAIQLNTGTRFIGETYDEDFDGRIAFSADPGSFAEFNYNTNLDTYTYGAFANVQLAYGQPVLGDSVLFGILGGEVGLNYSTLDGTDSLDRFDFGLGILNSSVTTDLDDDEWRFSVGANAGVGLSFGNGLTIMLGAEADYGKYANPTILRPDSNGAGALPSVGRLDGPDSWTYVGTIRTTFRF